MYRSKAPKSFLRTLPGRDTGQYPAADNDGTGCILTFARTDEAGRERILSAFQYE